jgi:hypothetical protein
MGGANGQKSVRALFCAQRSIAAATAMAMTTQTAIFRASFTYELKRKSLRTATGKKAKNEFGFLDGARGRAPLRQAGRRKLLIFL